MPRLSIVIPAYNEENYIGSLLDKIQTVPIESLGFEKEIIVVDDGSKDRTFEIASRYPGVRCFRQNPNQGKGRAVQRGIRESTGDFILVQDADLEYDPYDYIPMLEALVKGDRVSIYGSRTLKAYRDKGLAVVFSGKHEKQSWGAWFANVILTLWTLLLYGRWITDTLTAYKLYPADFLRRLDLKTCGFETDHEITARLIRGGFSIIEVPIHYHPRTADEGKKIKGIDGIIALWTLFKYRFI